MGRITPFVISVSLLINPVQSISVTQQFSKICDGTLLSPSEIVTVTSDIECALRCNAKKVCNAFSLQKTSGSPPERTCRLSMGSFTWDSSTEETLYHLSIENPFNYTLMKNGGYYISYATEKMYFDNIKHCDNQGATTAPCYKAADQKIIVSLLQIGKQFVSGTLLTSNPYSIGRWVTVDGDVFNSNNKQNDPLQKWASWNPDDGGILLVSSSDGTKLDWDDDSYTRTSWPVSIICRKYFGYERSPINGIYYNLHHEPVSGHDAAQRICESEGGRLANLFNVTNFAAVERYRIQATLSKTRILVGGTDAKTEGTWVMPDGNTHILANRVNDPDQLWTANEPSEETKENCLSYNAGETGLTDAFCDSTQVGDKFLCEIVV
ncbi:unnamed protein product [Notodromas monacha]|uniref:C-type lectin domain-containing protein n=1 Tax=Notodromas monacha TaxID=399045 RepID=A0A7R9C0Q9_9CRUS|nr:unnamed protein product [Notodromas monacha]CAG0925191.1 unnamed protein product [Notodromas monacha]